MARAHNALGEVARLTDDIATAEREYRRSLSIHHAIGSTGTLVTRLNLAMVLLAHGDATAAERILSPLISELSRGALWSPDSTPVDSPARDSAACPTARESRAPQSGARLGRLPDRT